jgi:two-component system NtrC family sensor kinase
MTSFLIEGAIAVRVPARCETATQLAWLSPCAASLLALARLPAASAWARLRHDPGAVLLVTRYAARSLSAAGISFFPAVLRDPEIFRGALHFFATEPAASKTARNADSARAASDFFVDWYDPRIRLIYHSCLLYARCAEHVAELSGRCDPENAWVAGLLAPLGWLAISAVDPDGAALCLSDAGLVQDPAATQQRHWGIEQGALTRRLSRSWRLSRWLALVIGHLGLPVAVAQSLGADPELLRVVQMAVGLAQQDGQGVHLLVGENLSDCAAALQLTAKDQEVLARELAAPIEFPLAPPAWDPPQSTPLLRDLLSLAAENLSLRDAPAVEQLEQDRDELHHALENLRSGEEARLQKMKLHSLAEFAAGAAHEINNPLAVISGQAQYLLGREGDTSKQKSLQVIISQAQRIHQVLTDVIQFARPPRPQRQTVDVRGLVREVMLGLRDVAAQRQVQLLNQEPESPVTLHVDIRQISTALECLLRNAVEAAPVGGWASLRVETAQAERLDLVIEDSGSGPAPSQREHMFDPFYSGRQAGRGRGLGLPTSWRLAREHGGEVRFEPVAGGPTRFVLSLPLPGSEDSLAVPANGQTSPGVSSLANAG